MDLAAALRDHFGFPSFRPGQAEAVQSLLAERHTLVVMPTGAGKSLIFQLTALKRAGLTLVISPLIALMKDQVDSLVRRGIPAAYINSTQPVSEQTLCLQKLAQGEYRLVYIAPERLRSVPFLNALATQQVGLLAVDEAHCISEWGHDFRPDYLHIAEARHRLGNPLTVALTATATPQVQNDIIRLLGLGDTTRIVTGFNRPNLTLDVRYASGPTSKLRAVHELLSPRDSGSVIVYTGTRRDTEEVAEFVREILRRPALFYHAGLPAEERTRIQNDFMSGKLDLVVATNAFGMGIDRADVRQVIHYAMPGSLEAYYQEAGRAGRDGLPARATLIYDPEDRALQEFFISSSALTEADLRALYHAIRRDGQVWLTLDELSRLTGLHPVQVKVGLAALERADILEHLGDEGYRMLFRKVGWKQHAVADALAHNQQHLRHRQAQLSGIVHYAEANSCRRRIILSHFGDAGAAEAADCCDNCRSAGAGAGSGKEAGELSHGERAALIVLDCIRRLRIKVGREKLAQILHGSKAKDIQHFHHDKNVYYGRLAAMQQRDIEDVIEQLIESGHIKVVGGAYPILALTPRGESAIQKKEAIALRLPKSLEPLEVLRAKGKLEAGGTVEYTAKLLAEGLRPEQVAHKRGLTVGTIYGHCAQLVERGMLELSQVIPPNIQAQIEAAIQKAGAVNSLSSIKMLLPEAIDYGMIRCVLAARQACAPSRPASHASISASRAMEHAPASPSDGVEAFLSKPHPRPLLGAWQAGWALGFHSRISGGEWMRSGVGDLTWRLKYNADPSALPALVQQALNLFQAHPEMMQVDVIVPVPASTERSLNPVQAFCEALGGKIGLPVMALLVKTRQTRPQKEMKTLAQKRANVASAFALKGNLTGRKILLVDDLFDSGATLEEITKVLLAHKVACVNVLTLTKTIHADA